MPFAKGRRSPVAPGRQRRPKQSPASAGLSIGFPWYPGCDQGIASMVLIATSECKVRCTGHLSAISSSRARCSGSRLPVMVISRSIWSILSSPAVPDPQQIPQHSSHDEAQRAATSCGGSASGVNNERGRKPLSDPTLRDWSRAEATRCDENELELVGAESSLGTRAS